MRRYIWILLIGCCVACTKQVRQSEREETVKEAVDSLPFLITQIRGSSRIYTTEYKIHKIITHDDVIRLKGTFLSQDFNIRMPLGDRKIAIPMDATLKAYIDMSDFSERNVERTGGKIIITLPDPQVTLTSSKIDQKNIKEYVGLVRSHFTDKEMTDYEQQGRAAILASIPQLGIIHTAQENAARVLVPLITQMGYQEEDIIIQFRKEFGLKDIQSLINRNIEHAHQE
ncbi:MAG: DUF4230 domain-containing protein [Prevotella sp.]|nr:DUF4230 domain-containing protein [Prevotella sp.]